MSVTESVAANVAVEAGLKVTEIAQFDPAASELPQLLVWPKLPGLVPAMVMPLMERAALPELERVAD